MNTRFPKKIYLPLLLSVILALSACDAKKKTTSTDATPVVAKVNGTELTKQQVDTAVQRIPHLDKSRTKEASLQVARTLVEQELLVQKAKQDKLDQDPKVMELLEAARRQVLAQAYIEKTLGAPTVPTPGEVTAYYNQHPELFGQRKLYRIQEVAIKAPASEHEAIRAQLGASKTLNDFANWIKTKNYPVNGTQEIKAAEELPQPLLAKLKTMADGEATVVSSPEDLVILVLAGSQPQPVTELQAKPAIERLVQVQKRQQAAKKELDKLMAAAKIEYLGEFAEAGKVDAAKLPAPENPVPSETPRPAEESTPAPVSPAPVSK